MFKLDLSFLFGMVVYWGVSDCGYFSLVRIIWNYNIYFLVLCFKIGYWFWIMFIKCFIGFERELILYVSFEWFNVMVGDVSGIRVGFEMNI